VNLETNNNNNISEMSVSGHGIGVLLAALRGVLELVERCESHRILEPTPHEVNLFRKRPVSKLPAKRSLTRCCSNRNGTWATLRRLEHALPSLVAPKLHLQQHR